ncbi:MAG: alpha/beta hydrolase [Persicimonas sp.]
MEQEVTFYSEGVEIAADFGLPDDYTAGEQRGAVAFVHGFGITKDIWFPDYARALREAGYITLRFDFRFFGESGGQPRQRLIPMQQVIDTRAAASYLRGREEVDADKVGLYGTSFGCGISAVAAAKDENIACIVGTAGPADCLRQFRFGSGFDDFHDKVRRKRATFIETGEADYLDIPRMMQRDPQEEKQLRELAEERDWRPEITFESMYDILEFKPEDFASEISPAAAMWIYVKDDILVPLSEGKSYYAKSREPKELVILEGVDHAEIYDGEARKRVLSHAIRWFEEHMPARSQS